MNHPSNAMPRPIAHYTDLMRVALILTCDRCAVLLQAGDEQVRPFKITDTVPAFALCEGCLKKFER